MKNNLSKYLSCSALIVIITALFLINPFFENKYLNAERNVQIFKKDHRPEYDSLERMYDIQSELMYYKNDSAKNVINQVFLLRNHKMEMQKLTGSISNLEYERLFNENYDLEVTEQSIVRDSFVKRLIRLHHPKEMKVPRDLSKEVTLYHGIDGFIGLFKWLLLVFAIIIFIIECLKYDRKTPSNTESPISNPKVTNDLRRHTKKAELFNQAQELTHQQTGNVTIAELTTPSNIDNVPVYVVSDYQQPAKDGLGMIDMKMVRRQDGQPFDDGNLMKGHRSLMVNNIRETSPEDFIQTGITEYDLKEQQQELIKQNTINIDGNLYVLTGDEVEDGYLAYPRDDNEDIPAHKPITIPYDTVESRPITLIFSTDGESGIFGT